MAQDLTAPRGAAPPAVRLDAGDEASGLATILGELVESNLRDFSGRRRVAVRTRGDVALAASDRDIVVTLSFRPGEVVVLEGAAAGAPLLKGPWLDLAKVCSGRLSPLRALAQGTLKAEPLAHPALLAATGFVLSVPESYYDPEGVAHRRKVAAGIAAGAVAAVGLGAGGYVIWRRRR